MEGRDTGVLETWLRQFVQRQTPTGTEVYLARQISERRYQASVEATTLPGTKPGRDRPRTHHRHPA